MSEPEESFAQDRLALGREPLSSLGLRLGSSRLRARGTVNDGADCREVLMRPPKLAEAYIAAIDAGANANVLTAKSLRTSEPGLAHDSRLVTTWHP
jgi:hypothetical protein